MLKRKIANLIEQHLKSGSERILLIDGARQVGKTYIIRHVGKKLRRMFDGAVQLVAALHQLVADLLLILFRQLAGIHQLVHVQPVCLV